MKTNKFLARKRRGLKTKNIMKSCDRPRLIVFRSINHIYCQIVRPSEAGDVVIAQASTLDKDLRNKIKGPKLVQAQAVGELIAKRAKEKDLSEIAFDRNGYKYHGRVEALAKAAREAGLIF